MASYVMVMRNSWFGLIGPFPSDEAAADWAASPNNNPHDDPRWQVLDVADPTAPVPVVPPDGKLPSEYFNSPVIERIFTQDDLGASAD